MMKTLLPRSCQLLALLLVPLLLGGCASDPIVGSLRPSPEDRAKTNKPAPGPMVATLVRLGDSARRAGDPASAIPFYRRAHALDRFDVAALTGLGGALSEIGAYNEAAEAFRDALVADGGDTEALRGLGNALISLNQPQLAIDQFEAALRIVEDYRSYNGIGVAFDRIGDHASAQAYYYVGLELAPDNPTLLNNLGLSLTLGGEYDDAIDNLRRVARQPGATARHRQNLALAYGLAGRTEEAAEVGRVDLAESAVRNNLVYYSLLRAMREEGADTATDVGVQVLGIDLAGGGEPGSPEVEAVPAP